MSIVELPPDGFDIEEFALENGLKIVNLNDINNENRTPSPKEVKIIEVENEKFNALLMRDLVDKAREKNNEAIMINTELVFKDVCKKILKLSSEGMNTFVMDNSQGNFCIESLAEMFNELKFYIRLTSLANTNIIEATIKW
jgi:hypothetical protein